MELKEVELKKVNDVMFKKIGVDVPMLADAQGFSADQLPVRALAVSNRFGYCLYAHSEGFSAAKTADLIEIAEELKDKSKARQTAQGKSIATVPGDNIRSLSLSADELTVAVCLRGSVNFYDLPTLVQKSDTSAFEVREVDPDDTGAKDFSWSPTDTDAYLIVTNNQKLLLGRLGSAPEVKVEEGVLAASWSEDGQHVAYVSEDRQLSITTSTFNKTFNLELPVHLSDEDVESELNVDAIRWLRPDSIMIGYVRINSEGEEDGYPLFIVTSTSGSLAEEQIKTLGLVFYQLFPSIDSFVTPSGSGPYMLVDYLKPWEMVVAASRKSIDDHIVLVGWLPENGEHAAYSLELGNDLWLPRIELQESGDDNALVGLAIDRTTLQMQLTDPKDESGDSKLPPCPVLICATLEGKLSFFSFARLDGERQLPTLVSAPANVPESKRSTTQSSQVSGKPSGAAPIRTSEELDELEGRSSAKQADLEEKRQEETSSQSAGLSDKSKRESTNSTVLLIEPLNRPSASLQSGPSHNPEGPKLGLISNTIQSDPKGHGPQLRLTSGSQDSKESSLSPGSALALRDTAAENLAYSHPGLYRRFEDDYLPKANFPPAFSFNDSARASSLTKAASLQSPVITVPSSALGTSSQAAGVLSKGYDKVLATRPVSPQRQRASQFPPAGLTYSLSSASPVKTFEVGASAFASTAAPVSGKVLVSGPMTHPPGAPFPSQGLRYSQSVGSSSQGVYSTQRVDKVSPGLQSMTGQDQQSQGRGAGVSDMEAAFISELGKVRRMAEEVDQLMSYIGGRASTGYLENNATFTRQSLEELEQGIHLLSETCKAHRRQLTREKQNVEDLRDESLRVDAWRIYAKSLMEQKNDSRHQELWTLQKLHPELDMKRKRLLKADQDLKLKIAEMEKHLHILELKQWQADNARRRPNKQVRNPGQFLSVQNLYNTVNAQMAVAEELSLSLTQQMEALNIDWSSPAKGPKKSIAASILKSLGAQPEHVRTSHMELNGPSPVSSQDHPYSPMRKGALSVDRRATPPGRVPDQCFNTQETTRRRRDSMDATWVESGAPKTTIKRPVQIKASQGFVSGNSNVPTFRQGKGSVSEISAKEGWSQSRNVRQTQSTKLATQSTNLNFSSPGSEAAVPAPLSGRTATSGPQWPSSQPDQRRQLSFKSPNGDFGVAQSTAFGSSSSVGVVETKESLFKWANNSVSGSKVTPTVPAHPVLPFGEQGLVGSFDGSSFVLAGKSSSTTSASKQYSSGGIDDTVGGAGGSVPATKPRLIGAFDGSTGGTTGKSVALTKGTMLANKFGSVSSTGNQMDAFHLHRENNQNKGEISLVGSSPLAAGPALSALTGPKPPLLTAPALVLSTSTSAIGASVSTSQLLQPAARSLESKREQDGTTDRENDFQPRVKQISVTKFPAQSPVSASGLQTKEVPSLQAKEPGKQPHQVKAATDSQNAPLATYGTSGKSFFDFSSSSASAATGSSQSSATVASSPGFTFATSSAPSQAKSLFTVGTNAVVDSSPLGVRSSGTLPSFTNISGSASSISTTAATISQPTFLRSSTAVDNSDSNKTSESPVPIPVVTPAAKIETQANTSTTSNLFPVPYANTGLVSGNAGAQAGGQTTSTSSNSSEAGKSFLTSASTASASQSAGFPFTTNAQSAPPGFTLQSASAPSQTTASPFASSSISGFSTAGTQMTSSPFGQSNTWLSSGQQFTFPNASSMASTASVSPAGLDSNEDDMEEEASTGASTTGLGGFGGFGGLGLGSSNTPAQTQKTSPFGGSLFGSGPAPTLSAPSGGQLFRPAAFSLPAAQSSSPQQSGGSHFGTGFSTPGFSQNNLFSPGDAGKAFGSPSQASPGGFGQPAQLGPGQQALGSALGAFGQTRQVGFGTPSLAASGGFSGAPQGGGFANAATGGGFANAATGGGFASATTGGGFANAATGGGFAVAATGGGFAGAATGSGFAGLGAGGGFGGSSGGGFQTFGGPQAGQPFGGGIQTSLFTQMRK